MVRGHRAAWRVRAVPSALGNLEAPAWLIEGPNGHLLPAHEVTITGTKVRLVREGERAVLLVTGTLKRSVQQGWVHARIGGDV